MQKDSGQKNSGQKGSGQNAPGQNAPEQAARGSNPWRLALARLRPGLAMAAAFSAAINVLMLTGSVYMLQVYDRVLASGSVPTLLGLFAIVVVLYGFLGLYDMLRARMLSRSALALDLGLGDAAFRDGLMPETGASPQAGGTLRDLDTLRGFMSGPAATVLFDLPFVPLFLAVLFLIHPWLGWLTLGGAVISGLMAAAGQVISRNPLAGAAAAAAAAQDFADRARGTAGTIRAMGMQTRITTEWQRLHRRMLATGQRASDPAEALAAFSRAFRMLLQSAILTLGAWLVLRHEISAGMIIASSILSGRALAPADQAIGQWRAIGRARGAWRRLAARFAEWPADPGRIDLPAPTGRMTVTRLIRLGPARAGADRARLLGPVSFELEPGDGLGVIGNSAAGKSTLARLITGAWIADAGEIRFDGATPDQWEPEVLGRSIGYLPQHVEMLPGTIRDNIARFDPWIQDSAVIGAARLTGVHEMILALPEGYATRIGGPDAPLSGGQIQRLGLARAICGTPRIVVLDEPNSNLDVAGDEALARTVAMLRNSGSVVIVMAHRPSALAAVNKLMILHAGQIARFGDKDEVLAGVPAAVSGAVSGTVSGAVSGAAPPPPRLADPPPPAARAPRVAPLANRAKEPPGIARKSPAHRAAPAPALAPALAPAPASAGDQADDPASAPTRKDRHGGGQNG